MKVSQYELIPALTELLSEGKQVSFKVSGQSMWPFFKDQKTTVTLLTSGIKKHDIVLAYYKNRYVLHRIMTIKGDNIILRGDGAFLKETIRPSDIIGKVISYENNKRINVEQWTYKLRVILWLYNPLRTIILRLKR